MAFRINSLSPRNAQNPRRHGASSLKRGRWQAWLAGLLDVEGIQLVATAKVEGLGHAAGRGRKRRVCELVCGTQQTTEETL